jgi:hypothetical protein
MKAFNVEVGFQVFLQEGGEEIGAVRIVAPDHVVVYVEGGDEFVVKGPAVRAAHDGKLILDATKLSPEMLAAIGHAHERETE